MPQDNSAQAPEGAAIPAAPATAATPADAVASAGGGGAPTPRIASSLNIIGGSRNLKGYPVTRDELIGLGGVSVLASVCFSAAGTLYNRSIDIKRDLDLAVGVDEKIKVKWDTRADDAYFYAVIFALIGVVVFVMGGLKVISIWWSTNHPASQ